MTGEHVELRPLDEHLLAALLETAVADSDPAAVMPTAEASAEWTPTLRDAFLRFHRERSLADPGSRMETTYVVIVGSSVAGAARLQAHAGGESVDTGVWLGRSHRNRGIGTAVLRLVLAAARGTDARRLLAHTTADNLAAQHLLRRAGAHLEPVGDGTVRATLELAAPR
ncbi:MAG TPA: GNAT family protein [Mycobacteriales bacterium]|nr:GNAT family protein [Mycobacteriales bacterium]